MNITKNTDIKFCVEFYNNYNLNKKEKELN